MKNFLTLVITFYTSLIFSQDSEFSFNSERGMSDFIITKVEGKTSSDIYKKIIEWIKITYKDPSKVILSTIENEYIRFEGSSNNLYSIHLPLLGRHYYPTKYQIEVSIKDGKYKFDIISMTALYPSSEYSAGGWADVAIFNGNLPKKSMSTFYNKKGEFKSTFKYIEDVPLYFNNLNNSIKNYILGEVIKSDW